VWARALGACGFLILVCWLQRFPEALEYQRAGILSGQIWRIWTGHWIHATTLHFLLNGSVAVLLHLAFFRFIQWGELLVTSFVFSALISGFFLLFMPELDWYNGLSGLLHAWVMYGSIRKIQIGDAVYWLGVVLVSAKVLAELYDVGPLAGATLPGVNVLHEAHLIGAVVGAMVACVAGVLPLTETADRRPGD
jgi:rhomboid family GlyGly-CTERM serine protease